MQMKKKIFSLAMVICCLSLIVGSTVAYVRTKTVATGAITTGKIDITLNEKEMPVGLNSAQDGTDYAALHLGTVVPGDKLDWNITVTNEKDSATAFIRVKYIDEVANTENPRDVLKITENDFWTYKDGWYYYNEPVKGGETTEQLFEALEIELDLDNSVRGSDGTIMVYAQAVQYANNGESALEAQGWPAMPEA